ncbi:hypothetical protein MMA231_04013 (plasmid) [Asticcacaulis sp. MM231]
MNSNIRTIYMHPVRGRQSIVAALLFVGITTSMNPSYAATRKCPLAFKYNPTETFSVSDVATLSGEVSSLTSEQGGLFIRKFDPELIVTKNGWSRILIFHASTGDIGSKRIGAALWIRSNFNIQQAQFLDNKSPLDGVTYVINTTAIHPECEDQSISITLSYKGSLSINGKSLGNIQH